MASTTSMVSSLLSQRLSGKVALITGGASGIGESIVRLFLRHGAKVCIADIQKNLGQRLCHDLNGGQDDALFYRHCDVTIEDDVKQAVDHTVEKFGTLDIMVNNAGHLGSLTPDIRHLEVSGFDQTLAVNLKGVFHGMKHAARVMIPAKKGSIVSLASVAGMLGGLAPHAYTCSKSAVIGLTKSVAAELGEHGIRVNCVSPYAVPTRLSLSILGEGDPSGGFHGVLGSSEKFKAEDSVSVFRSMLGSASNLKGVEMHVEDIANAALFLCSDEARYISGNNLVVDGGFISVNHSFKF